MELNNRRAPRSRQREGTDANTVFFHNNNSSGSEIILNRWQYFQQYGCQAFWTIVLETERYHARLGVVGTRKKGRVIKVLGDYGLSIEAGTFKNKRIRGILGEDVADADNIVPTRFKKSNGTRGDVVVSQVTHDLRRVRPRLLRS